MRHLILTVLVLLSLSCTVAYGQAAPTSAEDYFNRGNTRIDKDDLDGAIADHSKAIELNPKYAEAYYSRGFARGDKGELNDAIADYSKAIEINPKYANAYALRGLAKLQQGKDTEAQQDIDIAIKLNDRLKSYVEEHAAKIKKARKQKK